jgi:hypothetical protein
MGQVEVLSNPEFKYIVFKVILDFGINISVHFFFQI